MLSSGLLKQIKELKNSFKESINYFDVNYKGIDKNGSITLLGLPCVLQKYKIWLMSDAFDYHRNPGFGGFLENNVVKVPLSEANAKSIESKLRMETEQAFPDINLIECKVVANLNKRRWEITVVPQDKRSGLIDDSMVSADGSAIICYPN
jgi:hypothetical protein